ncbi:hypothetical protein SAMN06298216_3917 [Spirosomataceae bacterium TFI 002]|nr:hypothetical protein SAMN06298216_3917 [Spirosomataceae bacterium TFI 002]
MPVGEVIFGAIGEIIGYIIVEVIIEGIGKLIRAIYYGLRKLITGKEREIPELKRIEKRFLYKKFRLKSDFNKRILKGTMGTVMEVIDKQNLYVEFENLNGNPILIDDEQVFKIERKRIILERKKRTHNG